MQVAIVSNNALQSQLLSSFLEGHHGIQASSFSSLAAIADVESGLDLLLIDCYGYAADQLKEVLTPQGTPREYARCCALFNLARGLDIELAALLTGVRGFFYCGDQLAELGKGVRVLLAGDYWVSRRHLVEYVKLVCRCGVPIRRSIAGLSRREAQILAILQRGCTNREIADQLCISLSTEKTHIRHIFRKLSVKSRLQAIQCARRLAEQQL